MHTYICVMYVTTLLVISVGFKFSCILNFHGFCDFYPQNLHSYTYVDYTPWQYTPTKSSKLSKPQKFKPSKLTTHTVLYYQYMWWACKNWPSECKNHCFLYLLHYNLITIYNNIAKSFPLLQNLMDFLLQFTEIEYYTWNWRY